MNIKYGVLSFVIIFFFKTQGMAQAGFEEPLMWRTYDMELRDNEDVGPYDVEMVGLDEAKAFLYREASLQKKSLNRDSRICMFITQQLSDDEKSLLYIFGDAMRSNTVIDLKSEHVAMLKKLSPEVQELFEFYVATNIWKSMKNFFLDFYRSSLERRKR